MQVVSDYMSTNAATFAITNVGKSFAKFCAKSGNTVDFEMLLTSDAIDIITINLKRNNVNVATAIINADTRFRSIVWREKLTVNATYEVWFTRTAVGSTTARPDVALSKPTVTAPPAEPTCSDLFGSRPGGAA